MKNLFLPLLLILFVLPFVSVAQTHNYTGDINGDPIKATLTFNKDETVTGSFYFLNSSSEVYKISGTNFVQGEVEAIISFKGKRMRSGTLTKTVTNTHIVWEGDMWADQENYYITLKRAK